MAYEGYPPPLVARVQVIYFQLLTQHCRLQNRHSKRVTRKFVSPKELRRLKTEKLRPGAGAFSFSIQYSGWRVTDTPRKSAGLARVLMVWRLDRFWAAEGKQQIPPLRCGMTTRRASNNLGAGFAAE